MITRKVSAFHETAKELLRQRGKVDADADIYERFYQAVVKVDQAEAAMQPSKSLYPCHRKIAAMIERYKAQLG